MERSVSLRVFPDENLSGMRDWRLKITGGASLDMPMRLLLIPRGQTVAWSSDLDGDGSPEWVLEDQKVRAIFSPGDGGRWIEFTWKDTGVNFLPESGALAGSGPVEVRSTGDRLEFSGHGWKRTVRLAGNRLEVEQNSPLPAESIKPEKRSGVSLSIDRAAPTRAVYSFN